MNNINVSNAGGLGYVQGAFARSAVAPSPAIEDETLGLQGDGQDVLPGTSMSTLALDASDPAAWDQATAPSGSVDQAALGVTAAMAKGQDPLAAREDYISALQGSIANFRQTDNKNPLMSRDIRELSNQAGLFVDRLAQSAGTVPAPEQKQEWVNQLLAGRSTADVWVDVITNNSQNPTIRQAEYQLRDAARGAIQSGGSHDAMAAFAASSQAADAAYAHADPKNPRAHQVNQSVHDLTQAGYYSAKPPASGATGTPIPVPKGATPMGSTATGTTHGAAASTGSTATPAASANVPSGGLYLDMPAPHTELTQSTVMVPWGKQMIPSTVYSVASDNRPPDLLKAIKNYHDALVQDFAKEDSPETLIFSGLGNSGGMGDGKTPIYLLNLPDQVIPMVAQAYLGRPATADEMAHYKSIGQQAAIGEIQKAGQDAYLSQFSNLTPVEAGQKATEYNNYVKSLMYWTAADSPSGATWSDALKK